MTKTRKPLPKALVGFLRGLEIIGKTLLLLPILAAMAWLNYTVDLSGVFHGEQFEQDIALAMISGQAVDNYDKMDERGVVAQVAQNIEQPYDTLAFGSSRVLQLRSELAGGGCYFNSGVSGCDFVDLLSLYYQFEKAGMRPKTVILELDPWILSRHSYNRHELSDENLYNEFLTLRLGREVPYVPEPNGDEKYKALLSPTYMQGNLRSYLQGGKEYTPPAVVSGDVLDQQSNIKLGDGSVLYTPEFRNSAQDEVHQRALNDAVGFFWMDNFTQLDAELCDIFDDYVQYLLSQDIDVIFVLTPYHPIVYNNALEYQEQYAGFFETEPFFTQYALENDIPVYGSYNPFVTGTPEEDFFDGLHMDGAALAAFFPGVDEALAQRESGTACSPWLSGRVPVEEATAERLVNQRYEIPAEHELIRQRDTRIEDEACYVFGRYEVLPPPEESVEGAEGEEGAEEPPTLEERLLLARYAVSQDEGMIYRYDTDAEAWVVDRRALMGS